MEAIFEAQDALRSARGLTRVAVTPQHSRQRHGTKTYAHLLKRFGFEPTMPGPYKHQIQIGERGFASEKVALGERELIARTLVKEVSAGKYAKITAEDVQNDSDYLCNVQFGTPPQTLKLQFDSGSADLWVFSTELPKQTGVHHTFFNPSKSSTFRNSEGETWEIKYADGSGAEGDVGTDIVCLGGLLVKCQTVELAKKVSSDFAENAGDGILGLAWSSLNSVKTKGKRDPQKAPVENMIAQKEIPKEARLFTSAFYSFREKHAKSFFTFGWIDQELVKASGHEISWAGIDNSQGLWMFPSATYTINCKQETLGSNKAIADTGTTLALVSDKVCKELYGQIKGATYHKEYQGYIIPKTVPVEELPVFSIAVGHKEFFVQKENLLYAMADDKNWYGGVQSRGTNEFDVLGDTFLKSIYAIWDVGNKRFGAVPKF